jgi:ABC-2 type transport system ATP-binding protein
MEQLRQDGKTVFFSTHILADAETLCDRVAIINQGELRGVGAVADLTASVQSKVEIVWSGTALPVAIKSLHAETKASGETTRVVVQETQQDAVLEILRREHLRLISVTPVRTSLEEYYVGRVTPPGANGAKAGGLA